MKSMLNAPELNYIAGRITEGAIRHTGSLNVLWDQSQTLGEITQNYPGQDTIRGAIMQSFVFGY